MLLNKVQENIRFIESLRPKHGKVTPLQLRPVEEKQVAIDHAKVGGLIAERCFFPVGLVVAIRFHHAPSFARLNRRLPALVNIANSFAADIKRSNPDLFSNSIHRESFNTLKIDAEKLERWREQRRASRLFPAYVSVEMSR